MGQDRLFEGLAKPLQSTANHFSTTPCPVDTSLDGLLADTKTVGNGPLGEAFEEEEGDGLTLFIGQVVVDGVVQCTVEPLLLSTQRGGIALPQALAQGNPIEVRGEEQAVAARAGIVLFMHAPACGDGGVCPQ